MRAFIAINLRQNAKAAFRAALAALESVSGLKVVKEENLHLTLKFLGEIEDPKKIETALKIAVTKSAPFSGRLRGVGAFPSTKRPRVVWAGVENPAPQAELQAAIDGALTPLGFPKEKEFSTHLTLARAKDDVDRVSLTRVLVELERFEGPRFEVDSVELMRSTLTPKGPIYEVIATIPLGGV